MTKTETSHCPRCKRQLPIAAFGVDRAKPSGRRSICRACDRAKSRLWYARNREAKGRYYQANRDRIRRRQSAYRKQAKAAERTHDP
jgi:hypothetical protein